MFKAVIFDVDGVLLLGANKYHVQAWSQSFKENDLDIKVLTEEEYNELEGMKGSHILDVMLTNDNKILSQEIKEKVYSRKKEIFKEIAKPYVPEETKPLLEELKNKGLRLAVATGNNSDMINSLLKKEGLEDLFDVVVTGDEVTKGKPDPEIYLKTVNHLSFSPDNCVVIENTAQGIESAKAAGLYVIAITSTLSPEKLSQADKIIGNLREILSLV